MSLQLFGFGTYTYTFVSEYLLRCDDALERRLGILLELPRALLRKCPCLYFDIVAVARTFGERIR